jgi:hypothetical protein
MVERIIKNRVYLGWAYRGEQVNRGAHHAIVSLAEWQAANLAPVRAAARGNKTQPARRDSPMRRLPLRPRTRQV